MNDNVDITVLPDGPVKIAGVTRLSYCGEPLKTEGDVYLCRCGKSGNAPFCDGSHAQGFDGSATPPVGKEVKVWEGKTLRTFFNPVACMHVFNCKPLKELREAELQGDATAAARIMEVIGTCPSGALTFETKTDQPIPAAPTFDAQVAIEAGGEIRIQCAHTINAEPPERQMPGRATLCRCGLSKNKPWCDGRHKKAVDFR
jgi:CDGSH-type Zn-finger protein